MISTPIATIAARCLQGRGSCNTPFASMPQAARPSPTATIPQLSNSGNLVCLNLANEPASYRTGGRIDAPAGGLGKAPAAEAGGKVPSARYPRLLLPLHRSRASVALLPCSRLVRMAPPRTARFFGGPIRPEGLLAPAASPPGRVRMVGLLLSRHVRSVL